MKNKFCIIKDSQLRQIRENFRRIIAFAVQEEIDSLRWIVIANFRDGKNPPLEVSNSLKILESSLEKSTIICPLCHYDGITRDIFYNSLLKEWYCIDCVRIIRNGLNSRLEKKRKGELVPSGYSEEFASSFL